MAKAELPTSYEGLPAVTAAAMRELDGRAAQEGLSTIELMERAGQAVAEAALRFLEGEGPDAAGGRIAVCCGRGMNGGDGLVAARYLRKEGREVSVYLCPSRDGGPYPEPVARNLGLAREAGVPVSLLSKEADLASELQGAALVVDAVLGTGSSGKPAGPAKLMIQGMARSGRPVCAVDIPSGVNPDTGYHGGVFVTARETWTLAFPKRGLLAPYAQKYVGRLRVLDIGYPPDFAKLAAAAARR